MAQIILDYSANTHKNNKQKIFETISKIKEYDSGIHEIVFKSQLFKEAGDNIVCSDESFDYMYEKCLSFGYACTASVFDRQSMDFLLHYQIPFVKIANNRNLDYLMGMVPRELPIYISYDSSKVDSSYNSMLNSLDKKLHCVSEYPASIEKYRCKPNDCVSDHTKGLDLFKKFSPKIWEKHLILPGDDGLDAGPFAITPQELSLII